jgi:hypothetical protein
VVVDRGVHVVEPDAAFPAGSFAPAVDPPPAAVGDPAELLHVELDQVSGGVAFVAK